MSNASLAIYLGESYAEIEVRSGSVSKKALLKKSFFLPHSSLKAILNQHVKPLITDKLTLDSVFIVTRYLDRLKSFRLGGSVVQVLNQQQDNNYTFDNSENLSLAASALIISLKEDFTIEQLALELAKIKKVNPEASKVVISLTSFSPDKIESIQNFFIENKFSIFLNHSPHDMSALRETLINAGTEGTKEEIFSEIKESLGTEKIYFWIGDKFKSTFKNIDLYFSADQFLQKMLLESKKDLLIHTDLERWVVMRKTTQHKWQSPWGNLNYQTPTLETIGLHPFSEIQINSSGHLSFSKIPAAIEPGPMLAGRSVKVLVVDAFFKKISETESLTDLFPKLSQSQLAQKIMSQFKVLEKGQVHYDEPFDLAIIQDFIINKLGYDILLHKVKEEEIHWTGHLNHLFQRLEPEISPFSWTDEIFKRIKHV